MSWFSEHFGWAPRFISHHLCSVVKSDFIKTLSDPCLTETAKGEAERLIRFTHTHTHCIIRVVVGLCASVNRVMFEWVEGRSFPLIMSKPSTNTHTHTNYVLLRKHGIPPSSFPSSYITSLSWLYSSSITFPNLFFLSSLCPHRCCVLLCGCCCRITVLCAIHVAWSRTYTLVLELTSVRPPSAFVNTHANAKWAKAVPVTLNDAARTSLSHPHTHTISAKAQVRRGLQVQNRKILWRGRVMERESKRERLMADLMKCKGV